MGYIWETDVAMWESKIKTPYKCKTHCVNQTVKYQIVTTNRKVSKVSKV